MPRLLFSFCIIALSSFAIAPSASAQLVAAGSTWKYLDNGSDQGTAWQSLVFDDSLWLAGPAQFGYGDGDENTVVSYGPNASSKFITTYFRQEFTVANPAIIVDLTMRLLDDDGSVVYLNGTEILRSNLPAGVVDFMTLASSTAGARENYFDYYVVPVNLLQTGTNVLAVEVHQDRITSSDLSFDLELIGDLPPAILRGPYLQMSGPDRMTLRWRTPFPQNSRVHFGSAPGSLNQNVDDFTLTTEHSVTLTGLTAETVYYYSVGDTTSAIAGDDTNHWFRTSPPAGAARPNRFWLLGDAGTATQNQRDVRDAFVNFNGSSATDLILMLGDNAYTTGSDPEYQKGFFDIYAESLRTTPVWSARGNHEKSGSTYYDIFDFPTAGESGGLMSGTEAYYSFDFGSVHVISLDSNSTDRSPAGAMATWLAADLAATAQPWIVAIFHHPPYTKGSHNSDDIGDSGGRMADMREVFLPILENGGVDMVFSAHSHAYERSFLIDGHYGDSSTFSSVHQLDSGDGSPAGNGAYVKGIGPHEGAVYTTAGSAGKISTAGPLNHNAMQNSHRVLGSVLFDVNNDQLDITFLTSTGLVLDQYTLTTVNQPPVLSSTGLIAGQFASLTVSQATPGSAVVIAYSLVGPGPTPSNYGDILLDAPYAQLPMGTADIFGLYNFNKVVPNALAGQTIWFQALEITGATTGLLSNGLTEVVQ